MVIGILALQGAFLEHSKMLDALGVEHQELRNEADLQKPFDALIIPGGESTVMGKLLNDLHMTQQLQTRILAGLPVFGTCAGMILLASDITDSRTRHLATMDITVQRNAYGRQLGSFSAVSAFDQNNEIPMTFIRAPLIRAAGADVKPLAFVDDNIVAAQQGNQLVTAFHPELTNNTTVHQYFLNLVKVHLSSYDSQR